jgi:YegS/Rv2252/BmrU family lipid kinase
MDGTAKIIVNPYSGRWKARDSIPLVRSALESAGVDYDLTVTQGPGEGVRIAAESARAGFSPVVAVGGDSTYSEVANGLLAAGGKGVTAPMGIIPLGTANDLAYGLGLPDELEAAVELIARGYTRAIDVGRVNGRYFDNNSAVGLEPVVTLESERLVWVKGTIRYLLGALISILRAPEWNMTLEWDGGSYKGSTLLVSVGNCRRTGGFFFMTPQARPDDGLLDFVFAPGMSRLKVLRLLPLTFDGSHIDRPEVTHGRTTRMEITCHPGTPVQADGEVVEWDTTEVRYEVVPAKLTVIVGE